MKVKGNNGETKKKGDEKADDARICGTRRNESPGGASLYSFHENKWTEASYN